MPFISFKVRIAYFALDEPHKRNLEKNDLDHLHTYVM